MSIGIDADLEGDQDDEEEDVWAMEEGRNPMPDVPGC